MEIIELTNWSGEEFPSMLPAICSKVCYLNCLNDPGGTTVGIAFSALGPDQDYTSLTAGSLKNAPTGRR